MLGQFSRNVAVLLAVHDARHGSIVRNNNRGRTPKDPNERRHFVSRRHIVSAHLIFQNSVDAQPNPLCLGQLGTFPSTCSDQICIAGYLFVSEPPIHDNDRSRDRDQNPASVSKPYTPLGPLTPSRRRTPPSPLLLVPAGPCPWSMMYGVSSRCGGASCWPVGVMRALCGGRGDNHGIMGRAARRVQGGVMGGRSVARPDGFQPRSMPSMRAIVGETGRYNLAVAVRPISQVCVVYFSCHSGPVDSGQRQTQPSEEGELSLQATGICTTRPHPHKPPQRFEMGDA